MVTPAARVSSLNDTTPPTAPVLRLPLDQATPIGTPTFCWLPAAGADAYEFQYASDSSFDPGSIIHTSPVVATVCYQPPSMSVGVPSYWHVRARDASGNWGAWSSFRMVTVQSSLPTAPLLTAPAIGARTNNPTPDFTWASVPTGDHYQIQVATTPAFLPTNIDETLGAGILTYTPSTALNPDGLKYWRVRAWNTTGGAGAWSAVRSFILDTTPPAAPSLSIPPENATPIGTPTFSWLAPLGANAYQFEIATSSSFGADIINTSPVLAVPSYKPSGTLPLTRRYSTGTSRRATRPATGRRIAAEQAGA